MMMVSAICCTGSSTSATSAGKNSSAMPVSAGLRSSKCSRRSCRWQEGRGAGRRGVERGGAGVAGRAGAPERGRAGAPWCEEGLRKHIRQARLDLPTHLLASG